MKREKGNAMADKAATSAGGGRVCPCAMAFTLDNWIRRLFQDPRKLVGTYIRPGDTVVDLGCGPGFFTIEMARMVGPEGRIIAVDLQTGMLNRVRKKAQRHEMAARITLHPCRADRIGLTCEADFVLAFYMVHEVPDPLRFFKEIHAMLKATGQLLVVEPRLHVRRAAFEAMVNDAQRAGMEPRAFPGGKGGHAVLLVRR